jgi:radical SAM superfamily enzyme YgiQ (UPF0313 family)
MKVLLVKPPFNPHVFIRRFACCEPYEFAFLARAIDGIAEVAVLDMRLDGRRLHEVLEIERPDVVGFTALTMDVNTVRRLSHEVKKWSDDVVTCVGGEHATFLPGDFVGTVDYVFTHGSVSTFRRLIENLAQRSPPEEAILRGAPAHTEIHLQPDRSIYAQYAGRYIFGPAQPVSLVHTSSGCPARCDFCSIVTKDPKYRTVNIDATLENLASCYATDVLSIDAHALANMRHSEALYRAMATARLGKRLMISTRSDTLTRSPHIVPLLRDAGVSIVSMGLEWLDDDRLSGHNKILKAADGYEAVRLLKEHGILVRANFIITQDFTPDDFGRLTEAVGRMGIDFPVFQILTPLPGTSVYDENRENLVTDNYDFFDLSHSVLRTDLPFHEFHRHFQKLFRDNYSISRSLRLASKMPILHSIRGAAVGLLSFSEMRYNRGTIYA